MATCDERLAISNSYWEARHIPPRLIQYVRSGLTAISEGAFKLTFGALVIAAALGSTYYFSQNNFSSVELGTVLALGMAVSGVVLLAAQLLAMRSKATANVALAVVTLACVFTAYIVHTELYFPENRIALIGICAAALFGLFVAFRIIDEHRWGGLALSASALVAVSSPFWPEFISGITTSGGLLAPNDFRFWIALIGTCATGLIVLFAVSRLVDESHWGILSLLTVVSAGIAVAVWAGLDVNRRFASEDGGRHPRIHAITFQETPNVYFVGFDSIVPESIMQKYIGVETTDFHMQFNSKARRFRNLFANSVSTYYSINSLLALDQDIFLEQRRPSYFAGHALSPLIWIMRENGYETTSIFNSTFFGHIKGPHIDNYVINEKHGGICTLLDEAIMRWAFWGYCRTMEVIWRQGDSVYKGDFLVRELTNLDKRFPQFVIAHLYLPGHTPKIFNYDNREDSEKFTEQYQDRANNAATYLGQIIDHIESNDPTAILFVFGDHGMWLSRGAAIEDDPTFFLQDRFGILGGVYPPDRCAEYFDEAESKGYMTILDAVHAILSCLSGGQSALVGTRHDRFSGSVVPREHDYRYEEFLYE